MSIRIAAERTRMALGAGAFVLAAMLVPAVQLRSDVDGRLYGVWGLAIAVTLFTDRAVKRAAWRGELTVWTSVGALALIGTGVVTVLLTGVGHWLGLGALLLIPAGLLALGLTAVAR